VSNLNRRSIYVVTLWLERPATPDEPAVWRLSVEDARTGEQHGFSDLQQLSDFLREQTGTIEARKNINTARSQPDAAREQGN
jgi:hypothetical protein